MKYIFKINMVLFLLFFITACGDSTSSSTSISNKLKIEVNDAKLNTDKTKMSIDLMLTNPYSSRVGVSVDDLMLVLPSCDVDSVVFSPENLTFIEKNKEIINAVVTFNEFCSPTQYQLKGSTFLTLDGETSKVLLDSKVQLVTPSENQIIGGESTIEEEIIEEGERNTTVETNTTLETNTTVETNSSSDTINYGIQFSLENEEVMRFNLEDKKSIQIALIDKDTNNIMSSKKIISLKVISKQENLLKLFDSDENIVPSSVINYEEKNNVTVYVKTYTRSGLADIDVEIEYLNTKGSSEIIKKTYSTMILSGPPTAFSINTAGVSYNFDTKWFENKFLISAVDRYNNIVNISPTIYVSAMTGFTRDSTGKEILYGNFGNVEGKLNVDTDTKVASFEANSSIFDNIDVNRDYLYVFGQIDAYEALGKWDIDSYESSHSDTELALSEAFNGKNHNNLGFALGHNYLIDPGSSESSEWQVKIDSTDGKYQLDDEGKAFVTLKFPTYLVGKRTALAVNFLGKTPETGKILRSGEVKFKTLSSFEGVVPPPTITIPSNTIGEVTEGRNFYINTGTSDIWIVKNSHVSCITEATNVRVVGFKENKIVATVEEFKANGNSYNAFWELTLKLVDSTKAGSYSFKECQVRTLPLF